MPDSVSFASCAAPAPYILGCDVAKREVVKAADAATRLDAEVASSTTRNETIAFTAWITNRIEAAKVEERFPTLEPGDTIRR